VDIKRFLKAQIIKCDCKKIVNNLTTIYFMSMSQRTRSKLRKSMIYNNSTFITEHIYEHVTNQYFNHKFIKEMNTI